MQVTENWYFTNRQRFIHLRGTVMCAKRQPVLSFASICGKKVKADFDGCTLTSDGGALLLRWVESGIGVIRRLSSTAAVWGMFGILVKSYHFSLGWWCW